MDQVAAVVNSAENLIDAINVSKEPIEEKPVEVATPPEITSEQTRPEEVASEAVKPYEETKVDEPASIGVNPDTTIVIEKPTEPQTEEQKPIEVISAETLSEAPKPEPVVVEVKPASTKEPVEEKRDDSTLSIV